MKKMKNLFLMFLLGALFFHADADAAFKTFTSGENQDVPLEVKYPADTEPNVLFYLDTSGNMGLSMKGLKPPTPDTDPDAYTKYRSMLNANNRMEMIKQDTFGMGGRVAKGSTHEAQAARRGETTLPFKAQIDWGDSLLYGGGATADRRYGRDIDQSNNIIGHPDCYYSMDPTRPYLLTFRLQVHAEWNGTGDLSTNVPAENKANLTRLQQYLPKGGKYGDPVPLDLANEYLIPNDSKMYKLKLVLSKVLQDTPDNMKMLSRMKIGVASTFFEYINGDAGSLSPMKRPPYRPTHRVDVKDPVTGKTIGTRKANTYWYTVYDNNGVSEDLYLLRHDSAVALNKGVKDYQRDPGPEVATPEGYAWFAVSDDVGIAFQGSDIIVDNPATAYEETQDNSSRIGEVGINSYGGVTGYSPYMKEGKDMSHYKRSVMHVPFDFMYSASGDVYAPSTSLITFREFIDGIELFQKGDPKTFPNKEFFLTQVPGSPEDLIYDYKNQKVNKYTINRRSVYPTGPLGTYRIDPNRYSPTRSMLHERIRNSEKLMTGTVTGTILDFFSPPPLSSYSTPSDSDATSGVNWIDGGDGDTRGYFPVTSSCQDNWVVYFTTGNEATPGGFGESGVSMVNSFLNIARGSMTMRGRTKKDGNWEEAPEMSMDNPIRILVVGLIDTEGMENDPDAYGAESSDLLIRTRNAIRRMAHAGQPKLVTSNNADGFDFVPNKDRRGNVSGNAGYVIQPLFADNVPALIAGLNSILGNIRGGRTAGGAPRVQQGELDQNGELVYFASSYETDNNAQWQSSFSRYVIPKGKQTADLQWEAGEEMASASRAGKVYTYMDGATGTITSDSFPTAVGLGAGAPEAGLFQQWLVDYKTDAIISGSKDTVVADDNGVLGSMERSVPMFAPKADPKTVFIQTNRGVLHALNYNDGAEKWAFIPPPILENRLWRQKFTKLNPDGSVDASTYMKGDGEHMPSSQQMMMLDGAMTVGETDGGHYLIGALGLSGNGLYVMNVTDEASTDIVTPPKFLWAIDNDRYETARDGSLSRWGTVAGSAYDNRWEDLGLTIVAPELRRTAQNGYVGIVPGGLGWNLGRKDGDTQGRALYVFDYLNGSITKKIDTKDIAPNKYRGSSKMGMGISPVGYVINANTAGQTGQAVTRQFFTSDSDGDILFCDATKNVSEWELRSIFRVTNTTGNNKFEEGLVMPNGYALVSFPDDQSRWLFGGTADITAPETETVTDGDSQETRQRGLRNSEQYFFGLKVSNMHLDAEELEETYGMDDLTPLIYGAGEDQTDIPSEGPKSYGWYLKLANPDPDAVPATGGEYVSTAPFFNEIDGLLYIPTFTEYVLQSQGNCDSIGFAKLYAIDPRTGESKWDGGTTQARRFEGIKIMGITSVNMTGNDNTLMVATSSQGSLNDNTDFTRARGYALDNDGGGGLPGAGDPEGGSPDGIPEDIPNLQYWREMF